MVETACCSSCDGPSHLGWSDGLVYMNHPLHPLFADLNKAWGSRQAMSRHKVSWYTRGLQKNGWWNMVNQLAVQSGRLLDQFALERVHCEPGIHYTHSKSIKLDLWPKFFWSVSSYKYLVSHELFNWQGVTKGIRNSRMISIWGDLDLGFKKYRIPPESQMTIWTCACFRMIGASKTASIHLVPKSNGHNFHPSLVECSK